MSDNIPQGLPERMRKLLVQQQGIYAAIRKLTLRADAAEVELAMIKDDYREELKQARAAERRRIREEAEARAAEETERTARKLARFHFAEHEPVRAEVAA